MAIFNITINEYNNQPPSTIGSNIINVASGAEYIFTLADFTTETNPPYSDPEGDPLASIKVLTLPSTGILYLNAIAVIVNDVITSSDLNSGLFTYQADVPTETAYNDSFTFDASDTGSATFAGLSGTMSMNVASKENLPPSEVGDGTATIDYGETLVFTRAMFTTQTTPPYSDPEGDAALELKIITLPVDGDIKLNGVNVVSNQVIDFTDIDAGLLTYVPDLADTDGDMENFTFAISDAGSGQFVE